MKLVAFTLVVVGSVSVASADSLRAQAQKFDRLVASAMMKKDFKNLEKLLKAGVSKDFVYEEGGRKQNFDQMFQGMKMGLSAMKRITKSEAVTFNIKEKGDRATATSRHTMAGVSVGPDKKDHVMSFVGTSTDTFVRVGGKWKMSRMVMKTTTMTMDGKPMTGNGM